MDWTQISQQVADLMPQPLLVLDGSGRIQLMNDAMERTLGLPRAQAVGQLWRAVLTPPEGAYPSETLPAIPEDGQTLQLSLPSRDQRSLVMEMTVSAIGAPGTSLLVRVSSVFEERSFPAAHHEAWIISIRDESFGELLVPLAARSPPARTCYESIMGRGARCPTCPLTSREAGPDAVATGAVTDAKGHLFMVRATRRAVDVAHVHHEPLDSGVLTDLVTLRLATLAERAGLSPREHQVLDRLVLGFSLPAIAEELRISTRTVKFHKANVFEKLGIASRDEIARILVDPGWK